MKFPKQAHPGAEAQADARHRLEEARGHQRDMREAVEASKDTSDELSAATDLAAATAEASAREAWAGWTERGY